MVTFNREFYKGSDEEYRMWILHLAYLEEIPFEEAAFFYAERKDELPALRVCLTLLAIADEMQGRAEKLTRGFVKEILKQIIDDL